MSERVAEIILGPPGTGKTTTLIGLVEEELARGTPPDRVGYLSFTRKAAEEARERARAKFGLTRAQMPHFSTIHSLCYRQLGLRRGDVLEGQRLFDFANFAKIRITGKFTEDGATADLPVGDRVLFMENLARIRCVPLRQLYDADDDSLDWTEVARIERYLRAFKRAHQLLDYSDMLSEFLRVGVRVPLEVLLVDETQDLSPLQWRVIDRLAEGVRRFAVAGDDDQAIHRWAGADVDRLITMPGDARVLDQSWRVPPAPQRLAASVIRVVRRRREKTWRARAGEEGAVTRAVTLDHVSMDDAWREGSLTPPILVLARNVYALKKQVEPELRRRGVVYERNGHPSIGEGLMRVVRGWEALRRGESVPAAEVKRIFEWMSLDRGFARGGKAAVERLEDEEHLDMAALRQTGKLLRDDPWFETLDLLPREDVEYLRAALKRGEKPGRPRVVVSTIHGSKGGEADHVVLLRDMAWRTWNEMQENAEDEARVWYVGVTRARSRLTIVDGEPGISRWRCPWI